MNFSISKYFTVLPAGISNFLYLSKYQTTLLHWQHSSACWCTSPGSQADSAQPCQKKYFSFQSKSVKICQKCVDEEKNRDLAAKLGKVVTKAPTRASAPRLSQLEQNCQLEQTCQLEQNCQQE